MSAPTWLRVAVFAFAIVLASRDVRAQGQTDLVDLIGTAYVESVFGEGDKIASSFDFTPNFAGLYAGTAISSLLVTEIAGFPIGSSSGGFTYFFDATTGAAVRSSPSFGPAFAERPLTSGRGKLNIGLAYLHRSFEKLEGKDLEDGSLKFYAPLTNAKGLNVDLLESTFNLRVKNDTTTLFATYGLLNRLDLAVAVPIQRVSVEASIKSQLVRFGPSSGIPGSQVPAFVASRSGSATGVGDVAVRAKYNVFNGERAAVAGGLDVRLPTGDDKNLLGTGRTRTKLYGAVASKMTRFFPHANIGYTFRSKESEASTFGFFGSEISYAAGTEYVVNPRLTVVGDILGRSLAEEGRMQEGTKTYQLAPQSGQPAVSRTITDLGFVPGLRINSALGAIGVKFSPISTLIVSAHVLVPATNAGLKSRPTPVIGVDYTF